MSLQQEDRGVEPEENGMSTSAEEVMLNGREHVLDATNRPAAEEDDLGGD
jgi:hypothetical protein